MNKSFSELPSHLTPPPADTLFFSFVKQQGKFRENIMENVHNDVRV